MGVGSSCVAGLLFVILCVTWVGKLLAVLLLCWIASVDWQGVSVH